MTDETQVQGGKVRINIPTENYATAKAAGGGQSKHNGDAIATALQAQPVEVVYKVAAEMLGVAVEDLEQKYARLNVGMQRMNLGNRIRGAINKMNKYAESDAGKAENALTGDYYFSQLMEGYPLPAAVEKETAEETV